MFIFVMSLLLGGMLVHTTYFSSVTSMSVKRVQARSDLLSLTNMALKWLREELRTGTNWRAHAIESNARLADGDALCIFSLEDPSRGSVKIFDLGYDPENLEDSLSDPLFFPPSCPGGYLVRAFVRKQGLAPIMGESVFTLVSVDVPGAGVIDVLDEEPLLVREVFR
jgi:hypothetical protein